MRIEVTFMPDTSDPTNQTPTDLPALTDLIRLVIGQDGGGKGLDHLVSGAPPGWILLALRRLEEATRDAINELTQTDLIADLVLVPQFIGEKFEGVVSMSGTAYADYLALRGMERG
jgi:hypothetical protein